MYVGRLSASMECIWRWIMSLSLQFINCTRASFLDRDFYYSFLLVMLLFSHRTFAERSFRKRKKDRKIWNKVSENFSEFFPEIRPKISNAVVGRWKAFPQNFARSFPSGISNLNKISPKKLYEFTTFCDGPYYFKKRVLSPLLSSCRPLRSGIWPLINKLKTTPTPNKKRFIWHKRGGFVCHIFGSVCHIFCRNPLTLTDFYAIRTPIVWHILGAYFLQIWEVGVVRIIFV